LLNAGEIHLLMTDVVMPEMNGQDLAKTILPLYPDMMRLTLLPEFNLTGRGLIRLRRCLTGKKEKTCTAGIVDHKSVLPSRITPPLKNPLTSQNGLPILRPSKSNALSILSIQIGITCSLIFLHLRGADEQC
jgi:CheY-like chemotaxis protein